MIRMDAKTRKITCPIGDTGLFVVTLADANGDALAEPITGVVIFAVATKTYTPVFHKVAGIVNNTATIQLTNADTRALTRGEYRWDVRVVTDPEYDTDGNVICQDTTDEVHSLYSATGMPVFEVTGVAIGV